MEKKLLKAALAAIAGGGMMAGGAGAFMIDVTPVTLVEAMEPGNYTVLEDFDDETLGWYGDGFYAPQLETTNDVTGDPFFTATPNYAGTGGASYSPYDGNAYIEVSDDAYSGPYGRGDLTGGNYLESGDVGEVHFVFNPELSEEIDNLNFYLIDPSDVGAITGVYAEAWDSQSLSMVGDEEGIDFPQSNGGLFRVSITLEGGEYLDRLTISTMSVATGGYYTGDGWGIDKFYTNNPIPEPATMLLFGTGLAGLAGISRRRKK